MAHTHDNTVSKMSFKVNTSQDIVDAIITLPVKYWLFPVRSWLDHML